VDAQVADELSVVLGWAEAVGARMQRSPEQRHELGVQGRAYIGGVLTTLDHLGLLSPEEHHAWAQRMSAALESSPE
jgi:hypothetical protein